MNPARVAPDELNWQNSMRAEMETLAEQVKQSLSLLRRHL
jgi:Trm5-related predicted tRNA methylase